MAPETPDLKGSEKKHLRSLAHRLKPVVYIGKTGLSPNVITAIDDALEHHELIKIRFQNFKDQKKELLQTVVQESNCTLIGSIGHIYMLYRQHPDPEKRKINLAR